MVAAFDGGAVTSDAGALLLGGTNRAIGRVTGVSTMVGCRPKSSTKVEAMVAQRVMRRARAAVAPKSGDTQPAREARVNGITIAGCKRDWVDPPETTAAASAS